MGLGSMLCLNLEASIVTGVGAVGTVAHRVDSFVQCTLSHRMARRLCLRCSSAECGQSGRATYADVQSHPCGSFPLPEDYL